MTPAVLTLPAGAWAQVAEALAQYVVACRASDRAVDPVLYAVLEVAHGAMSGQDGPTSPVPLPVAAPFGHGARVEPDLLSYVGVAQALSISLRSVKRLVASGDLLTVLVLGSPRVRRADLERYIDGLGPRPFRAGIETKGDKRGPAASAPRPVALRSGGVA